MIKLKLIALSLFNLLFAVAAFAQADSSVTVSTTTDNYEFVYQATKNSVQVNQKLSTTYTANVFQASIPVAEMFNNQVSISNVSCKIEGRTPKDFKPLYTYYGSNDIFYSDEQICYFPVTIPKKGGTAVVTFDEVTNDPRYFNIVYFPCEYKIGRKEVNIKIPRWMKVEIKEYNFNGFNIKKSTRYLGDEDADVVTYTMENLPATTRESNSPGPTYLYPHLLVMCKSAKVNGHDFTYFNTLDDQYNWYRNLVKAVSSNQDVITAKAKDITTAAATDLDKIKAVLHYVQDNIRYIAFEDGIAGFKPESADDVLRKKYGDCKGMANLIKSLLTALGYDARLCWLGTNHIAYDYQTPSMMVDNHMICALNYQGKTYFLDGTESYLGFNEYAERIQGRQVLIEDGDKYILSRIPVALHDQNIHTETGKFTINGDSFTGSVNQIWKGEEREQVLAGLNSVKKEKTETAMISFLSLGNSGYQVSNMGLTGTHAGDKDMQASYQVTYKDGLSVFGKDYYVDMDNKKELRDAAIKIDERKHDYWFGHKANLATENELAIPAGYKVATLPPALNIVNANYEFHIQYVDTPGKIIYKKSILLKNTHLTKANFAQWNNDIEQLAKTYNESVILKPIS